MHPKTRGTSLTSWSEVTKRNNVLSLDEQYSLPWITVAIDRIHPSHIKQPTEAQKSWEQCSMTQQVRESWLLTMGSFSSSALSKQGLWSLFDFPNCFFLEDLVMRNEIQLNFWGFVLHFTHSLFLAMCGVLEFRPVPIISELFMLHVDTVILYSNSVLLYLSI